MKTNLLVMFGGVSCEHDISVITGLQALKHLDENKYNIIPLYITKSGVWLSGKVLTELKYYQGAEHTGKTREVTVLPNDFHLYKKTRFGYKKMVKIDCAVMCFHGMNGEDGTISGLMQLNNIPYTACSVFASSLACDKINFKYAIKGLNLKYADFLPVNESEYHKNAKGLIKNIVSTLAYPVIVKPSRLGSSIGISVCNNDKHLTEALELAFNLDENVLVEKFLTEITEINCAVLGVTNDYVVSELEEPIKTSKILSFENKYLNPEKQGDMEFLARKMPPNVSKQVYKEIVDTSKTLFTKLGFKGVIRIDYILTKDNEVLVNEINTIPGSLANYLFKPQNLSYTALLDKMINIALSDNNARQQKIKTFKSDVLNKLNFNFSIKK